MANAHRQYTQELHGAFGNYWATWLPTVHLRLGDVGTMEDGIFVPRAHLNAFGITFGRRNDPQADAQFQYQSQGGVQLAFKAKGRTNRAFQYVAAADSGVGIDFTRENAVVFSLRGCSEDRIDDQRGLATKLLALPQSNFPQNYVIVTHLVSASSGTILVSSSHNSRVEIRAEAAIGGLADLANVEAGLAITYMSNMQTQIVASAGLTPLFRAVRICNRWFGGRRVESFGGLALDEVVEDIDYMAEG